MKKPIYKTAPYFQKVMTRYPIDSDIKSLAVADDNTLYAASCKGLHKLQDGAWSTVLEGENITAVHSDKEGKTYAASGKILYAVNENEISVKHEFEEEITALGGETRLYVLTGKRLFGEYDGKFETENWTEFVLRTSVLFRGLRAKEKHGDVFSLIFRLCLNCISTLFPLIESVISGLVQKKVFISMTTKTVGTTANR